jgi:hypothetical protein
MIYRNFRSFGSLQSRGHRTASKVGPLLSLGAGWQRFDPEGWGSTFLRNVGILQDQKVPQCRTQFHVRVLGNDSKYYNYIHDKVQSSWTCEMRCNVARPHYVHNVWMENILQSVYPLLGNGLVTHSPNTRAPNNSEPTSRQRPGKHIPA